MSSKLLRLLLVEDSENDALLILSELKSYGYETNHQRVYTGEAMRQALNQRLLDRRGSGHAREPFLGRRIGLFERLR